MYHCVQSDVDLASGGVWGSESRSPACSVGSGFGGLVGLVRFLSVAGPRGNFLFFL